MLAGPMSLDQRIRPCAVPTQVTSGPAGGRPWTAGLPCSGVLEAGVRSQAGGGESRGEEHDRERQGGHLGRAPGTHPGTRRRAPLYLSGFLCRALAQGPPRTEDQGVHGGPEIASVLGIHTATTTAPILAEELRAWQDSHN